jgi:hypothetical protein
MNRVRSSRFAPQPPHWMLYREERRSVPAKRLSDDHEDPPEESRKAIVIVSPDLDREKIEEAVGVVWDCLRDDIHRNGPRNALKRLRVKVFDTAITAALDEECIYLAFHGPTRDGLHTWSTLPDVLKTCYRKRDPKFRPSDDDLATYEMHRRDELIADHFFAPLLRGPGGESVDNEGLAKQIRLMKRGAVKLSAARLAGKRCEGDLAQLAAILAKADRWRRGLEIDNESVRLEAAMTVREWEHREPKAFG